MSVGNSASVTEKRSGGIFQKIKNFFGRFSGNNQQSLIEGALILTLGVALVKIIGAIVKIPLGNIIGEAGMGYYSSAYNLYLPFYTLSCSGFPSALSRMVAENIAAGRYKDVIKTRKVALNVFLVSGSICFAAMVITGFLMTSFGSFNPDSIYAILCMSPSVFLCCVMSAYRGYNEGMRNMVPTATSQVIEALGKLFIGLVSAVVFVKIAEIKFENAVAAGLESIKIYGRECSTIEQALNASYPFAAAGALLGITLGSAIALLYMMGQYKLTNAQMDRKKIVASPKPRSTRAIFRKFLEIGIPIALGVLAVNLTQLIDSATIQEQIAGLDAQLLRDTYGSLPKFPEADEDIPNFLWGAYNMAITLYNLVPYLTQTFGISAIPTLAAAWVAKDKEKIEESVSSVLKLVSLIALPCGIGLCSLSPEILNLLYHGKAAATICIPILRIMGITAVFGALAAPLNNMLQAIGKQWVPVILMSIGAVIKIIMNYTLVGVQEININGAPVGSLFCYAFMVVGSVIILCRTTKVKLNFMSTFGKPLIAALLCGLSAWATSALLGSITTSRLVTFIAILVAVFVYIIALFVIKGVSKSDILLLPKGEKIAKTLEKRGWIS